MILEFEEFNVIQILAYSRQLFRNTTNINIEFTN